MSSSIHDSLGLVISVIGKLMVTDNIPLNIQGAVSSLLTGVLLDSEYVTKLLNEIQKINTDGKVSVLDLPAICCIVKSSTDFMKELAHQKNQITSLNVDSMKYILYGMSYFILLEMKVQSIDMTAFTSLFEICWKLTSFDPKEIEVTIKKSSCLFCCCK